MKSRSPLLFLAALLILLPAAIFAQNDPGRSAFSVVRSSGNNIQIRFELPQWKLETVTKDGASLQRVSVEGAQYNFIGEEETLPVFATMIAIPYSGGASLNFLGSEDQTRFADNLDFGATLSAERQAGRFSDPLYPAQPVLMSEPQVIRDFRVVALNVNPFQYDPATRQLLVRQSVDISIQFDNLPSVNEITPPTSYSSAFESIYRGLIINFDQMLNRDLDHINPKLLVIYGAYSDATYLSKVDEYVSWKRQKGYLVDAVNTTTAGGSYTAIKTYIQGRYDNLATRPDYITIIGDDSGTIAVPTYYTYMDYYYTWLAGGDNLGDVIIGRISVDSSSELVDYMGKIRSLEKDINLNTAAWLNRMVLVGDTASSGISTIYTNEYIHDHSVAVNPDYTYTEVYTGSPSSTTINAAINQGVAFYNYRGYINMSYWPNTMSSMSNTYRLFHAVFITCATGSWGGGTSTTESVVRYGTEATLGGAVTAIGMATASTHTPMNNCLDVGIFHGIYSLGMRDMASAMLYGKLYLYAIYGISNPTQAYNFSGYCNIIGDPTASVYVGIPSTFTVTAPGTIPSGASNLAVNVKNASNLPVKGASVVLTDASGQRGTAFTDANGDALLEFISTLSGDLTLTVDKDDFKTLSQTVSVSSSGGLVYDGVAIDDDTSDDSNGNGDGEVNGGETIELYATLKNTTTGAITPSGRVSTTDPYVTLINWDRIEYNAIAANSTGDNISPIVFQIAVDCPDQHEVVLHFALESTSGNFTVNIPILISNGNLNLQSYSFVGSTGNYIYPGDTYPLTISLTNAGSAGLTGLNAVLRSNDMFLTIPDSLGYYGSIAQGATVANASNTFTVNARSTGVEGMVIPLSLYLYNNEGYAETIPLTFTLGQTTLNDPLGQDAYGYFIFDQGDTSYDQCPTYSWVGIAPAEGGSGTALSLTDNGDANDEGDQVGAVAIQTVSLPFSFKFYGIDYTQASISSNGFIAFGDTNDADWRNWRMPDAGGPSPMIAVFWDDLDLLSGTSNVYTYYNSTQHYYVVEWYNMIAGYDSATHETFQAILYDPTFYPTHTGDGPIKLQYKDFHNIDLGDGDTYPHGNFCTIGIEDHTETDGLEYTFNNTYPTAAATLGNESALYITTRPILPNYPYIAIEQVNINDTNSNAHMEPGETANLSIRLGNRGLVDATGVTATISTSDPYVTVTAGNSTFGTIPAQGNALSQTNYSISVSSSCPADHQATFTLNASGNEGTWSDFYVIQVYIPELAFTSMVVNDVTGDQNGILDPGETAVVTIHLANNGEVASPAGSATLSCATTGITINTGTDSFAAIPGGSFEILTFNLSAASSMSDGTLVQLNFNATAGTYTAAMTENVEVGAPLEIIIGNGSATQSYPIDRYYNYSAHEAIFLASEINLAGSLKSIAFYKASGADTNSIDAVTIYIKHTTATSLTTGNYSLTGYTQVFSGSFTNNSTSGWMEVNLNPMFVYDGVSNLQILTIKGYQQYISNYPQWTYTTTTANRARHNHSDSAAPTSLSANTNLPNLRLKIFPDYDMLLPPQDLSATASHQSVYLAWTLPAAGTPTGYKLYRNSALIATQTGLTYTDLAVTNGTTYSYYVIATYTSGESEPSTSVSATPNTAAPTNLIATAGNTFVNLSWTGAAGRSNLLQSRQNDRSISGYRIYRNGTAINTVTGTTYQDSGLTNGISYSYYVTTVYANPTGESGASNTASATPNLFTYVTIGTGTSTQSYPLDRYYNYSTHEAVYLSTEIGLAGSISTLAFQKGSGDDVNPIEAVTIYMKETATSSLTSGDYSTTGYTQVFSGSFTNNATSGWMEVNLTTPFVYSGSSNLSILTVKGNQQWINNYPYWTYTSTGTSRARQERSDDSQPTALTASYNLPNLRLKITPTVTYLPPTNLTAAASHQSVNLSWSAPASGTPTGYRIYKNSSLLTTVTTLTYTDLAVTNGTTYSYYLTAVYSAGVSDPTPTVTATPNAIAPTNLTAVGGNALVNLSWTGTTGREELGLSSMGERTISSYRIYRNGSSLTTVTGTTYQDTGLTNGVAYSYYVTTVYANPAGESAASNTATATPSNTLFVIIGTSTNATSGNQNSPINISNNSVHGQSVYTAAELNAAGVTGPVQITGMGFYVVTPPNLALPNFLVRMKHTSATNGTSWITADNLVTTYSNASYLPTAGGYDMLTFSTPFEWNGTDNILIDTAFSPVATASQSGTLQYTFVSNGYRFAYSNLADQTNVFTGGIAVGRRYNVRLAYQDIPTIPEIAVNPTSIPFGSVLAGATSVQQFTITNSGTAALTGSITTPTGYSVAASGRNDSGEKFLLSASNQQRNTLAFNIAAGSAVTYNLTFAPTAVTAYNGNVVITSNDSDVATVNLAVTGTGANNAPTITLPDSFSFAEDGSRVVDFSGYIADYETPDSGLTLGYSGNSHVTVSISGRSVTLGASANWNGTETLTFTVSDGSLTGTDTVNIIVTAVNDAPTINLPASFSFDQGATLPVNFAPYVADVEGQTLSLAYSGNTNILVSVNGLQVSLSALAGWSGTETLTFTVSDGIAFAHDTVAITVNAVNLNTPAISAITSSASGVTLQWNSVPNATGYKIYRSTDPYGGFVYLATTTLTNYLDTQASAMAFYQVRAINEPPAK